MDIILYDGAGNLFRMIDGRGGSPAGDYAGSLAQELCILPDGRKADGLIVLRESQEEGCLFSMHYFNNDGSGGVMCGNGGRCAVAFARDLGIPFPGGVCRFSSNGSRYTGTILQDGEKDKIVKLEMADVHEVRRVREPAGWYADTGCPHFVTFLEREEQLTGLDIGRVAPPLRHHAAFGPGGVNVNFVVPGPDAFGIRSFERGVEGETLACGTGIVAAAIALALESGRTGALHYDFRAVGGQLAVDLTIPTEGTAVATGICLTGPTHRH